MQQIFKLDYIFGTSGEAAVGKRKLRCRIGPSVNNLQVFNVNDDRRPHFVDSPYFTGHVVVRVKNFRGITPEGSDPIPDTDYFGTKKRLFSIQLSGRFKQEYTAEDVIFGAEFENKVNPPTGAWIAIKFANLIDPALATDIYSNTPWLFSPMLCAMNIVNVQEASHPVVGAATKEEMAALDTKSEKVTVPAVVIPIDKQASKPSHLVDSKPSPTDLLGEWVWGGDQCLDENNALLLPNAAEQPFPSDGIAERRKYFQKPKNAQELVFRPDKVYHLEIFAPFIDLNTFDLNLGINVNLIKYLCDQPIRLMAKSLSKNVPFFVIEFDLSDDDSGSVAHSDVSVKSDKASSKSDKPSKKDKK
ncbi:hypothetical protein HK102_007479 [Quaeritorhiza haematococci]|nr:hypothetical protein HK102_007479 [Quaeritorhiza haematococci]